MRGYAVEGGQRVQVSRLKFTMDFDCGAIEDAAPKNVCSVFHGDVVKKK